MKEILPIDECKGTLDGWLDGHEASKKITRLRPLGRVSRVRSIFNIRIFSKESRVVAKWRNRNDFRHHFSEDRLDRLIRFTRFFCPLPLQMRWRPRLRQPI